MLAKYTESLDKVEKIKHDIIAPGHGDLISEPHNRIKQMKLHHKRRSEKILTILEDCLLYTSPSPRDATLSRMPSSA